MYFFSIRYFSCPAQSGLFVLASKVTPLNSDSDSVRSLSPPQQQKLTLVTNGTRAARYINMTANQLTQQKTRSMSLRSPTSSLNTPLTSPISSQNRNSLRKSQPNIQSPTPTHHYQKGLPSPAMTPTHHHQQHHHHHEDEYHDSLILSSSDDIMLTETPIPENLALSKSLTTDHQNAASLSTISTTTSNSSLQPHESAHERLERVLGEAISQAPDEQVMKLQQLQLRVEVLEAENKYLKLENTQNKTAEQIIERSLVLKKKNKTDDAEEEEMFTLEGHKAMVKELQDQHTAELKKCTDQNQALAQAIQRLETKVQELEAEQQHLITERDKSLFESSTLRKEKSTTEHQLHELETKLVESEATVAAALAKEKLLLEKTKTLQDQLSKKQDQPQFYVEGHDDRQMKLELEMEEMHEKLNSAREAARAKDMFLASLSEQVEIHRNAVEEKEREMRRIKADADRHVREKEHVLEELKEVEQKWLAHQDCTPKEQFDKIRKEYNQLKEKHSRESALVEEYRERIQQLQVSVDELKRAGMESIELYESSVEMHRVDLEAINATLADERRKVTSLELKCDELKQAGLDTIEAYEATVEELKKDRSVQYEEYTTQRDALQSTIDTLKQEIDQLMKNVESEEKHTIMKDVWESERKRLLDQIESLERGQSSYASLKQEAEQWKEQTKEVEKLQKEKSKLEEQVGRLQYDYDEQLQARTKYLEEIKASVESQKKTEGEVRRLVEAKEKLERELVDAKQQVGRSDDNEQHQLEIETFRSEIEKLQAQNSMLMKQKEQTEQSQQDVVQYQQLIHTLKSENKKITKEYSKLQEVQKQNETECLKLMEEVEKLHQQMSQDEATKLILNQDVSEQDKVAQLLQQHQKKIEQVSIEHTTELRQVKEKTETMEKEYKRQITLLNRDISELESLIESKIFKEADLEEALEKERKQVRKLQAEISDMKEDNSSMPVLSQETKTKKLNNTENQLYCEICEDYGHDLISCKAVSMPEPERPVSILKC